LLLKYHIKERCEIAFVGMANTSRINPATMPTKRGPPPQGVASLRKSNRRRITKKKSNDDSNEDPPPETLATMPTLLKSPPELIVPMPPRADGDDDDDYATMPPRAHGDDDDDYNVFGEDDGSPVVKSNPNGLLYSSDDDDDDDDDDTFKFDADLEDFPLEDYADPNMEAKLPGKRRLRYDDEASI
jgi:hypothetical protein